MAYYLKSSSVKVYPTSHRGTDTDPEAYFTTEKNITTSGGSLSLQNKSFVQNNGTNLTIVIDGYVFKTTLKDIKTSIGDSFNTLEKIYAFIKTQTKGDNNTFEELVCVDYANDNSNTNKSVNDTLDDDTHFKGLGFDTSVPENCKGLLMFKKGELVNTASLILSTSQIQNNYTSGQEYQKPISEEFTTKNITNSSLDSTNSIYTEKANYAVVTDENKKLITKDLSKSADNPTDQSENSFTYVDNYEQSSDGAITTLSRKTTTISHGDKTQATFKVNNKEITINNLGDGGEPTFHQVHVTSGADIKNTLTIGSEKVVDSEGKVTGPTGVLKVIGQGKIVATEDIESEKSLTVGGQATINDLVVNNTSKLNSLTTNTLIVTGDTLLESLLTIEDNKININIDSSELNVSETKDYLIITDENSDTISTSNEKFNKAGIGITSNDQGTTALSLFYDYNTTNDDSDRYELDIGKEGISIDCGTPGSRTNLFYINNESCNINVSNDVSIKNELQVDKLSVYTLSTIGTSSKSANLKVYGQVEAESFNATSDRRLKENIKEYVCDKSILDLPIYKYDFINGEKNQIGCIAQDLKEICPEIVKENKEGYLSIQESKIVYLLLEEVKKLKERVDELEGK